MQVYILLDRSGSMASRWSETLSSLNSYVGDLAKDDATKDAKITLVAFDEYQGVKFDTIRDHQDASSWRPIASTEASPRGGTPLFDAIGRLVPIAEKDNAEKAVVVVLTDGHENASREVTKDGAKAALDRARAKGWQVVFLGADFDAFDQAAAVGTQAANTLNMTRGNYAAATQSLHAATSLYAASGRAMNFSDEDRQKAAGRA